MPSAGADTFAVLTATIHWLGRNSTPAAIAAEILRRSQAERMNSRSVVDVCAEMTGGSPLPFVRDPEAMALAERLMAAAL